MITAQEARRLGAKEAQIGRELNRIEDIIEKAARTGALYTSVEVQREWIKEIIYALTVFEFKTSTVTARNQNTITIKISWKK